MTVKRIDQLSAAGTIDGSELTLVVQSGVTKQITLSEVYETLKSPIAAIALAAAEAAQGLAEDYRDTANSYMSLSETYMNETEDFRDTAASYAASAGSAVFHQNLETLSNTIAATAVDVFVYNTALDSDGGEWRNQCQHTSWYNEELNTATRGSRREFPAVAVIVAEATKVTIYDGDDPTLPMWCAFTKNGSILLSNGYAMLATSCYAINGIIAIGLNCVESATFGGLVLVDLTKDESSLIDDGSATCGNGKLPGYYSAFTYAYWYANDLGNTPIIIDAQVNDVALTILPNAGTDPATGLQYVTAAVATDGGVSVIKNIGSPDESVSSLTQAAGSWKITFTESLQLVYAWPNYNGAFHVANYPDYLTGAWSDYDVAGHLLNQLPTGSQFGRRLVAIGNDLVSAPGNAAGLTLQTNLTGLTQDNDVTNLIRTHITSSYNTGYMPGDIKLATLADTDTDSIVGAELVTNGDFATNDLTSWSDISVGTYTADASTGSLSLIGTDGSNRAWVEQAISVEAGKTYVLNIDQTITSGGASLSVGTSTGNVSIADTSASTITFTPSVTTVYIGIRSQVAGGNVSVDNISVREAVPDRSVNNNGLAVYGTITRNPVNTGNDLVAYSGFSSSNYLQQPYNSDLDFGTGDFYVMGWFKLGSVTSGNCAIFSRGVAATSDSFQLYHEASTGKMRVVIAGTNLQGTSTPTDNSVWTHIAVSRSSGIATLYLNADIDVSGAASGSLTGVNEISRVGMGLQYNVPFQGSISLLRIGAGALTAEEIKAIYEAEKPLFQAGAQATLYGSSDAVTALAHDPITDLLHVGTSSGRSVFKGLQRIDNTEAAVATAISASAGLVIDE